MGSTSVFICQASCARRSSCWRATPASRRARTSGRATRPVDGGSRPVTPNVADLRAAVLRTSRAGNRGASIAEPKPPQEHLPHLLGQGEGCAAPSIRPRTWRCRTAVSAALRLLRDRQEGRVFVRGRIERLTGDPPEIVDVARSVDLVTVAGRDERAQVGHGAVLPEEAAAAGETGGTGDPDDLPPVVDSQGLAERIARERAEVPDAVSLGPQERVRVERAAVAGGDVGEPDDVAPLVDGHRRIPGDTAQVADIDGGAVFPEHRVNGAEPPDGPVADPRDADHLTAVVDGGGGSHRVAGQRGKHLDLIVARPPDDGPELQDLRGNAGGIVHGRFRPSDYLAAVVRAGGKSVAAPQRRKRADGAPLPHYASAGLAGARGEERAAAPSLAQGVRRVGLGNPRDEAKVVFHRPDDAAVGPTERAEIDPPAVEPQGRVLGGVPWKVRRPRRPAQVIQAVARADRSAKRRQVRDDVCRSSRVVGRERWTTGRRASEQDRGNQESRVHAFHRNLPLAVAVGKYGRRGTHRFTVRFFRRA